MTITTGFAAAIVLIFTLLGLTEVLALAPARALAGEAGFSVAVLVIGYLVALSGAVS